jgi:hypothetical protein
VWNFKIPAIVIECAKVIIWCGLSHDKVFSVEDITCAHFDKLRMLIHMSHHYAGVKLFKHFWTEPSQEDGV